ncbi:hypothetical protein Nepgr_033294 [Nepenthes gracilis]|uniref:DUF7792 domain-containing protein n=1 Tax=Nepenthes gracilis TaxID=150966 RepID=A0AAD3TLQ4_NEPGR|nr:hypothetical protein Nepgr_033294 [Nepenthes gracilis]
MAASASVVEGEKTLQNELAQTILLAERVRKSALEADSSKLECLELTIQLERITDMLRSIVRLATSTPAQTSYDRPIRRIIADVWKNLERAQSLMRKCKHRGFLRQVFAMTTLADFKKVSNLLESSIANLKWLLSHFDGDAANLALPPITSSDPTLAWVWSHTASLELGRELKYRIDSANELAYLARDHDRNKKMIVEEGAVPRLLKMLKDGGGSAEGKIAAVNALSALVDSKERTRVISAEHGIPIIVQVLGESSMKVDIVVANLVARMAEVDETAREEFGKENVMKRLVSCLLMDLVLDDHNQIEGGKASLLSIVQINKELAKNQNDKKAHYGSSFSSFEGVSRGGHSNKRDREDETDEFKYQLKTSCALALWRLCEGSLLNSRKIVEAKGLLCLAKNIETARGQLQLNCLMTVMEIAAVAEANPELRKAAWKPTSPPAKAVLDQLLRVLIEESNPDIQIPAIKAIGSLARTFPAKESRIMGPLVAKLASNCVKVAAEAAISLGKFVSPDNYNRIEHSKAIIEFKGVPLIMKLLKANDLAKRHGLVLLCHLSVNVGNSKALEEARALNALEGATRFIMAQYPELRDLFYEAIHQLALYQAGVQHRHSHAII